jgi:hypothetical protein
MKDASFFLVVRFSIEPQVVADVPFEKHMRIERFFAEAERAYGA